MRLAEDRFYNQYPCVIISGKGQPDVATRLFLNKAPRHSEHSTAIASTLQPQQALYSHSKHSTAKASTLQPKQALYSHSKHSTATASTLQP